MKDVAFVPVRVMLVRSSVEVPAFVSVTFCASLTEPLAVAANVRLLVLSVTEGAAVPVPLSLTVCGEPLAVSAMLREALRAAAEAGLNAT